jgi:DNA-binding transcriptional regulator YiaG
MSCVAIDFDKYQEEVVNHESDRVKVLQHLIDLLKTSSTEKTDFTRVFKMCLRVLELDHEFLAREFKISRPTVSRWEAGVSAPHQLGRKPVYQALLKIANAKHRQHGA